MTTRATRAARPAPSPTGTASLTRREPRSRSALGPRPNDDPNGQQRRHGHQLAADDYTGDVERGHEAHLVAADDEGAHRARVEPEAAAPAAALAPLRLALPLATA